MQICTYRMRMSWLPFVVELITFLLISVRVMLFFLKQISWSTRIFLIIDEVWGVIMGGFNKCRWSESKKRDIAWIQLCLYLKESFIFFLHNILFFFWFVVKYEHNFFLRDPPNRSWSFGTVVTDVLTHWSIVILETCTRLSPIFPFSLPIFCQFHFILWLLFLS